MTFAEKIRACSVANVVRAAWYGNSLTYGLILPGYTQAMHTAPAALQSALAMMYGTATVLNKGVGGDHLAMMLTRYQADVAAGMITDFVLFTSGSNDAAYGVSVAAFRATALAFVAAVRANGSVPVILLPTIKATTALAEPCGAYAAALHEVAAEQGVPFVDLQTQVQWLTARYYDGTHLTDAGYHEMGFHVGALFPKTARSPQVAHGTVFDFSTMSQFGGTIVGLASSPYGFCHLLLNGARLPIPVECLEAVVPIITSVNESGGNTLGEATLNYAAGLSVAPITLSHNGSPLHKNVSGPTLHRGHRMLDILATVGNTQIESIRFQAA